MSRSAEFAQGLTRIDGGSSGRATDTIHMGGVTDEHTDRAIAESAGFDQSHLGFKVHRYDDSTAAVSLWKD